MTGPRSLPLRPLQPGSSPGHLAHLDRAVRDDPPPDFYFRRGSTAGRIWLLDHDPRLVGAARVLEQGCGRYLRKVRTGPSGPARFVLRGAPRALGLVQLGRGEVPRVVAADAAGDEDATVEKPRHAAGQTSGVHRAGRAQLAGRRIEQLTCG